MKPTLLTLLALPLLAALPCQAAQAAAKPNVVIMLADDTGWADLSLHKGSTPTPAIDRLFNQSVRMSNFMAWSVCSPTRAMLLTGRHPFRVGTGPGVGGELDPAETTIAEAFKANGYATGVFGKWHNGEDPDTPEYRKAFTEAFKDVPNKKMIPGLGVNIHGFDDAWVYYGGGSGVELYDLRKDISESTDVSKDHPEVVKALTAKMDAWTHSLGAQHSHLPAIVAPNAKPAPEGDVLEIVGTVTPEAKPRDRVIVPIASLAGSVFSGDRLEFDIAVAPGSLQSGFFYSPFKSSELDPNNIDFRKGKGVDQFGREQVAGPAPKGGPGTWEHRVIGLAGFAPNALPRHAMVFTGGKPGDFKVYIDNVRVLRADGTTTTIWASAADTRARRHTDTAQFKAVSAKPVPLDTVSVGAK